MGLFDFLKNKKPKSVKAEEKSQEELQLEALDVTNPAVKVYLTDAKNGDPEAQYQIGKYYYQNDYWEQAYTWFEKAAQAGHPDAQFSLFLIHPHLVDKSHIVKESADDFFVWLKRAAEKGQIMAQETLGYCHMNGYYHAEKDEKKGIEWYEKAAEQGDAYIAVILGGMYQYGDHVERNTTKALYWYEKGLDAYRSGIQWDRMRNNSINTLDMTFLQDMTEYLRAPDKVSTDTIYRLAEYCNPGPLNLGHWTDHIDAAKAASFYKQATLKGNTEALGKLKYLDKNWYNKFTNKNNCENKRRVEQPKALPHMCIGTIGNVGSGKTTLSSAISKVLQERYHTEFTAVSVSDLDHCSEEKISGKTIEPAFFEYRTRNRRYTHIDCPGHNKYIKNMIAGVRQMDAAILVVSTMDGLFADTLAFLKCVPRLAAVFINHDPELVDDEVADLVESELKENHLGFVPFFRTSALEAMEDPFGKCGDVILEMMNYIDTIPVPKRDTDGTFCMPIYNVYDIPSKGAVVTGRILQGSVHTGAALDISGYSWDPIKVTVREIQHFHKEMKAAEAGECVGILLEGVSAGSLKRGQLLVAPDSEMCCHGITAEISFKNLLYRKKGEGKIYFNGSKFQCIEGITEVTGSLTEMDEPILITSFSSGVTMLNTNTEIITLKFDHPVPYHAGAWIILLDHKTVTGWGEILYLH